MFGYSTIFVLDTFHNVQRRMETVYNFANFVLSVKIINANMWVGYSVISQS